MKRKTTVWNWHGDTDGRGEPIPATLIYRGPAKDYHPGGRVPPSQFGRRGRGVRR